MSESKGGPVLAASSVPRKAGEAKFIFRQNVTDLVDILHVNQKQAAEMIGVPYKWLWRMAKKGISRIDDRNLPNLQKVAAYFEVSNTDEFWREGLICWLLASEEECSFVEKFKLNLEKTYQSESAKLASVKRQLMDAIGNHPDIVLRIRSERAIKGNLVIEEPVAQQSQAELVASVQRIRDYLNNKSTPKAFEDLLSSFEDLDSLRLATSLYIACKI